jgi:chromosome segregation ATPase
MGERRNMPAEDKPAVEDKPAPRQAAMTTSALADAVKLLDQELERIARTYEAAQLLRAHVGGSVQVLLDELVTLDQRKAALVSEIATLETQKAGLVDAVAEVKNEQQRQQAALAQLQADVAAAQKLRDELTALR